MSLKNRFIQVMEGKGITIELEEIDKLYIEWLEGIIKKANSKPMPQLLCDYTDWRCDMTDEEAEDDIGEFLDTQSRGDWFGFLESEL